MTEKEKCAAGLLYDANYDAELVAERTACQSLCFELNQLAPTQEAERTMLLRQLLGTAGERLVIVSPFFCDYGRNVHFGTDCFLNTACVILDEAEVRFGNHVFVGPQCGFYTACHPFDVAQRNAGLEYARPIHVGNDVWIGGHVTVLAGVTIGDGSVIGAGSVVTHDIPSGVIAVGNPCRVLRPCAPSAKN